MFIGATGCGKSGLVNVLEGRDVADHSVQEVVYGEKTIDIPSEYVEHPRMFQSLIAVAQNNASHVVFVVKQGSTVSVGSPGLGSVFTCPVSGVVIADTNSTEDATWCFGELKRLGATEPYFVVNLQERADIGKLADHLFGGN